MISLERLRLFAAIVFMACFFVPVSQFSNILVENEGNSGLTRQWEDLSAYSSYEISGIAAAAFWVLIFGWPLLSQLSGFKWSSLNSKIWYLATELALLLISCYYVGQIAVFGQRLGYGSYLFASAAVIYGIVTSMMIWRKIALTTQSRGPP